MTRDWNTVLQEHLDAASKLGVAGAALDAIADAIIDCFNRGKRLYIFGNGGSAADAQHIAGELLGRFKHDRRALPAMALTTDASTVTAISNDLGYDRIFERQLAGLATSGDVIWALSTSGNSPNVLLAVKLADELEAITVGFTGQSGGKLAELCTHVFRAPHHSSDRIQEMHELAYHYVCERVEAAFV